MPKTIIEKIWNEHVVDQQEGAPAILAIDLHLVHEVTSPQAFTGLRARGLKVRRPDRTVATVRSGRRTFSPRARRPVNAWGLVTSCTRCRSIARMAGAPSC